MTPLDVDSVAHENLRTLCALRAIPLAGMLYGVFYLRSNGVENLHWPFLFALLAILVLVLVLTWLRSFRTTAIGHGEFFGHLLVDIGIYSLLMFNTGGATNPFISYLLVPLTIAAIALPAGLTLLVSAICLVVYTVLLFWHIPLPAVSPGHMMNGEHQHATLNLHVIGMWLNFMVSALLIAYFINRMAKTIAAQNLALYRQQQRQLEDEQLLAVATLAASAAHELGTPLNTMKLICDDWRGQRPGEHPEDFDADVDVLGKQIDRCQETLRKLSGAAREFSGGGLRTQGVRDYFSRLLDNWLVMRPDVKAELRLQGDDGATIHYHPALTASIHNLLNNAGDASPRNIQIDIHWNHHRAQIAIRDHGQGIPPHATGERPMPSDKPAGMGLGLFLARTILSRHQAEVQLLPQSDGGTLTTIILPLRPAHD